MSSKTREVECAWIVINIALYHRVLLQGSALISVHVYSMVVCHCTVCGSPGSIAAVTADGILFAHPLHHLGKTKNDLPVLAIDSFRHMYVFPNFEEIR